MDVVVGDDDIIGVLRRLLVNAQEEIGKLSLRALQDLHGGRVLCQIVCQLLLLLCQTLKGLLAVPGGCPLHPGCPAVISKAQQSLAIFLRRFDVKGEERFPGCAVGKVGMYVQIVTHKVPPMIMNICERETFFGEESFLEDS